MNIIEVLLFVVWSGSVARRLYLQVFGIVGVRRHLDKKIKWITRVSTSILAKYESKSSNNQTSNPNTCRYCRHFGHKLEVIIDMAPQLVQKLIPLFSLFVADNCQDFIHKLFHCTWAPTLSQLIMHTTPLNYYNKCKMYSKILILCLHDAGVAFPITDIVKYCFVSSTCISVLTKQEESCSIKFWHKIIWLKKFKNRS